MFTSTSPNHQYNLISNLMSKPQSQQSLHDLKSKICTISKQIKQLQQYCFHVSKIHDRHYRHILQISKSNPATESRQSAFNSLVSIDKDFQEYVRLMVQQIYEGFGEIQGKLEYEIEQCSKKIDNNTILDMPVESRCLELGESDRLDIIEKYFSKISFQQLPVNLKKKIVSMSGLPSVQFYEIPVEVDLEVEPLESQGEYNSEKINTGKFFVESKQDEESPLLSQSSIELVRQSNKRQLQENIKENVISFEIISSSEIPMKQLESSRAKLQGHSNLYSVTYQPPNHSEVFQPLPHHQQEEQAREPSSHQTALNSNYSSQLSNKSSRRDYENIFTIQPHSSQEDHSDREDYVKNLIEDNKLQKQVSNYSSNSGTQKSCNHQNKVMARLGQSQVGILQKYYELKEYNTVLQEEKSLYLQQLRKISSEIQGLSHQISQQQLALQNNEQEYHDRIQTAISTGQLYKQQLEKIKNQLKQDTVSKNELLSQVQEQRCLIDNLEQSIKNKQSTIAALQEANICLQNQRNNQMQRYMGEIENKQKLIEELGQQYLAFKSQTLNDNDSLTQSNIQLKTEVQDLKTTIDHQLQSYQQLQSQYNIILAELMNLELKKQNSAPYPISDIYSEELNRIYEQYEKLIESKTITINKLQNQNLELNNELGKQKAIIRAIQERLALDQKVIEGLSESLVDKTDYHDIIQKILPRRVVEEIQYLREELIGSEKKLEERQAEIQKLKIESEKNIQIEFIEDREKDNYFQEYSRHLEEIVETYEQIIVENYFTINQLQQRVYDYLRSGIEKQKGEEYLYEQLLESENELNKLLLDKISLETENKKMKKMIKASQKKISLIGSRLIKAAKKKLQNCSQQTSNQTQKPIQPNLLNNRISHSNVKRTWTENSQSLMGTFTK